MRWFCVLAALPVLSLAAHDRRGSGRYNGNFHGFAVTGACQHGDGLFGGGFNCRFKPRMALRVEFRLHAIPAEALATGRIGLSLADRTLAGVNW